MRKPAQRSPPRPQQALYGPASAEVQHLHDRINAIDLVAEFVDPRGTRAFAADRVAAWQRCLHALLAPDGTVEREPWALDEDVARTLDWYYQKFPPEPRPASLTLEWAEGPLELLAEPGIPTSEDSLDCYGWFHGGFGCQSLRPVDFLRDTLREHDPALRTLARPPMWLPFQVMPDTTPVDLRPLAGTPLAEFVVTMFHQIIRPVFNGVLAHALLYPRVANNPYEPALALIEHGLLPLSSDDHACYVFRYNPEPVTVPAWLPYFTVVEPLSDSDD